MKFSTKLKEFLIKHLQQFPYIILYPITSIFQFIYNLAELFYSSSKSAFSKNVLDNQKQKKVIEKAIASSLHSDSNILNSVQSKRVAKVFTLLLQFISFVTTYSGFVFFLGTVNPVAPLFMAITIQGLCYYLLNYTSTKKHRGGGKKTFLLAMCVIISITTSYMGIFDSVVKPVELIKNQYKNYEVLISNSIEKEIQKHNYEITYEDVDVAFKQIKNTLKQANDFIDVKENTINNTERYTFIPITWTDDNGIVRYGTKKILDTEAVKTITQNEEIIADLSKNAEDISTYIEKVSVKEIYDNIDKILKDPSLLQNDSTENQYYTAFSAIIEQTNSLRQSLCKYKEIDEADLEKVEINISEAVAQKKQRERLNSLKPEDVETLVKTINKTNSKPNSNSSVDSLLADIKKAINALNNAIVSEELVYAQDISNLLEKEMNDNINETRFLLDDSTLDTATELSKLENVQLMPFKLIIDSIINKENNNQHILGEALFSFFIAAIIDLLSVFISLALLNRKKSILYYEKIDDISKNREEMIEDCFVYICMDSISETIYNENEIDLHFSKTINNQLKTFMKHFHYTYLPKSLNSFAYLTKDDINDMDEYQKLLFTTFRNASLIHPCNNSELITILKEEFGVNSDESNKIIQTYETEFNDSDIYYLISKNLHFWFCENISELLENNTSNKTYSFLVEKDELTSPQKSKEVVFK